MAKIKLSDPENSEKVIAALRKVKEENRAFHVIPSRNRWVVIGDRPPKARKVFAEKDVAIEHATQLARDHHITMVVHSSDGSIEQEVKFHH